LYIRLPRSMSNKNITWLLICLMCFSVLGLVYIQFYWINEAYTLKEQEFKTQVNDALHSIVKRLEHEEVINTMMNAANNPKGMQYNKGQKNAISDLANDIQDYTWFRNQTTQLKDLEFGFTVENTNDAYTMFDSSKKDHGLRLKYSFEIAEPDKNLRTLLDKSSTNQWELIQDVIKQLNTNKSIQERIDRDALNTLIKDELIKHDIQIQHEYILTEEPEKVVIYQFPNKAKISKLFNSNFNIRLFPKDIISKEAKLYVWFPKKNHLLLDRLAYMLIGSFLLILFIIACFIYAVGVIKKQKIVSDMKTDFINNMTHEFKTPIATISLASEALNESSVLGDENKIKRFVKVIFDENTRLKNQVEKVLQFAKIDKGEWHLQKFELNVNQVAQEIVDSFYLQVKEKNGTIDFEADTSQPIILADRVHFKNILSNLIDNGMKYCQKHPEIKVKIKSNNKGISLLVYDNGIGMNKEEQQKVFDKFYRVSQGNIHDVKGFGLGLSYVHTMTQAHGGHIKVKSQKNKGSLFEVFFPFNQNNNDL